MNSLLELILRGMEGEGATEWDREVEGKGPA